MSNDDVRRAFEGAETLSDDAAPAPSADDQDCDQGDDGREFAPDYGDMDPAAGDQWRGDLPDELEQKLWKAAAYPLNDYGNGQRLVEYFGDDILFVPRLGWNKWNGRFWQADDDELDVRRSAQKIAGRILQEVPFIALESWETDALDRWASVETEIKEIEKIKQGDRSPDQIDRFAVLAEIRSQAMRINERLQKAKASHRAHAKNTGNTSKISNMMQEAQVAVAATVDALNANELMVNCQNGTLEFVHEVDEHDAAFGDADPKWRVNLLPHDRAHLISKMMLADFDADAQCPNWMKFLETIQPDPLVRGFLQRWFGLTLTGIKTEQKLAFFHGSGRNGKSTMIDTIARIMSDYGTTIPIETLTGSDQRKGSDATPDLVRLPGARLCRASEPEQGQRMKEALIKALTGGEAIMIRKMQKEFVEIEPEFKLVISGNHKPEVRGADDGIWRRILLVVFDVQIASEDVDEALPRKLWAERDGIFAWMVAGCIDYLNAGLQVPDSINAATNEYREDSDPVRVFLQTQCTISGMPDDFVKGRDLVDAFVAYQLNEGLPPWGRRTISNAIKAREGVVKGEDGVMYRHGKRSDTGYIGIRINSEMMDLVADLRGQIDLAAGKRG